MSRTSCLWIATFSLCVLASACSSSSTTTPSTSSASSAPTPAPVAEKHHYMVVADANAQFKPAGDDVQLRDTFSAQDKEYLVVDASAQTALDASLKKAGVTPKKVIEIRDINSPVRGGGQAAGAKPRDGHKTYVIERNIPGIGTFPDQKKQAIAKKSNAAVSEIGNGIEWDHSYLTDEGTFCVYRATGEDMIRKHASITGAPVNNISEVHEAPTK